MVQSEFLMRIAMEAAELEVRAEYWGETVAAGYFRAGGEMLLEEAKRLRAEEEAEEVEG